MNAPTPLAVSRQRDPVALTLTLSFALGAVGCAVLSAREVGQQDGLAASWVGLMGVTFAIQVVAWWRRVTSVITVDALRVTRVGRGGEVWRLPRAEIDQVQVVHDWGRPYLALTSREAATIAPMCRWFLRVRLPRNAAVGPVDPAKIEPILAALGQTAGSTPDRDADA